jgi:hypothetical protein
MTQHMDRAASAASKFETFLAADGNISIRLREERSAEEIAHDVLEAAFEKLDNVIRKVDGNHDLGAGALAEAIRTEILGEEA